MAQKKNNKVSVAAIEKAMKENFAGEQKTFNWCGLEIEYKEIISMEHMVTFVDEVVDSCFDKDGDYIPAFKDFLIRTFTIQLYSNVRLPQDITKQYDILFGGDLYAALVEHINQPQYQSIMNAINEKLSYRCNADVIATRETLNQLIAQFKNFGEQLDQVDVNDIRNIAGALNGLEIDEAKLVDAVLRPEKEETVIEDEEHKIVSIRGDDE